MVQPLTWLRVLGLHEWLFSSFYRTRNDAEERHTIFHRYVRPFLFCWKPVRNSEDGNCRKDMQPEETKTKPQKTTQDFLERLLITWVLVTHAERILTSFARFHA